MKKTLSIIFIVLGIALFLASLILLFVDKNLFLAPLCLIIGFSVGVTGVTILQDLSKDRYDNVQFDDETYEPLDSIIFLDFDGVLTSDDYTRLCVFECRQENLYGIEWFDPRCIDALRAIVEETGAGIVVSSSWRELGMDKLKEVWAKNEMPGELLGTTNPDTVSTREAILQWLEENPCDTYVVLDDSAVAIKCLVKTNPKTGLVASDAVKAIKILILLST